MKSRSVCFDNKMIHVLTWSKDEALYFQHLVRLEMLLCESEPNQEENAML